MSDAILLPALRGNFGDWIYYSCLISITEVGKRVRYAEEIHSSKALSELIQRSLEGVRARHISEYLARNNERFFNSLVLAIYGGAPQWLEVGNYQSTTNPEILKQISQRSMDTMGFLQLSGSEKIFAIDGQHRLAGIKRAIADKLPLNDELIPVILVGHKTTIAGMRRTRRLFTTLNKTAVPVRKSDIIALDEDDVMAITARRMVESEDRFKDPKIAVISSPNIPVANRVCLTTISNLYDILKLLFMYELQQRTDRNLRFNRPSDERLNTHYTFATAYFDGLAKAFPTVKALFDAPAPEKVTPLHRGPHGGDVLFRPIGLEIVTRVIIEFADKNKLNLSDATHRLRGIPTDLSKAPYKGVIWDSARSTMIPGGKRLARDLLRYIVGLETDIDLLRENYAVSQGADPTGKNFKLPARLT